MAGQVTYFPCWVVEKCGCPVWLEGLWAVSQVCNLSVNRSNRHTFYWWFDPNKRQDYWFRYIMLFFKSLKTWRILQRGCTQCSQLWWYGHTAVFDRQCEGCASSSAHRFCARGLWLCPCDSSFWWHLQKGVYSGFISPGERLSSIVHWALLGVCMSEAFPSPYLPASYPFLK